MFCTICQVFGTNMQAAFAAACYNHTMAGEKRKLAGGEKDGENGRTKMAGREWADENGRMRMAGGEMIGWEWADENGLRTMTEREWPEEKWPAKTGRAGKRDGKAMEQNVNAGRTEREPMFSDNALRALLLPLLLEQFLSVSMGMADTVMVASVGEAAVSSVSLVDNINLLVIQVLAALATGGAVVASQYLGHREPDRARHGAAQLYTVLLLSTVLVAAGMLVFRHALLLSVFGAVEEQVMHFAEIYLFISVLSYPFMGIYNAGAALFRAQGNSRISMYASLVMNVINIAGNAVLIFVFGLGVLGAAMATLAGRVFAALWVTARLQRQDNPLRITAVSELKPDGSFIRRILSIGIPSGLENGMFQIGKLIVSSLTCTLGTTAIAANAVANTVSSMANIPGNGVSLAMIPVVGQCLGAGEREQAKRYAVKLMKLAYLGIALTNVVLFLAAPWTAHLFQLSDGAVAAAVQVLHMFAVVSILFWPSSFTLPNALRAGGDARYTMLVSLFSMWSFRVVLSHLFVLKFHWGLPGVWMGMFIDWIFRSLLFWIRFWKGTWMEHKVI